MKSEKFHFPIFHFFSLEWKFQENASEHKKTEKIKKLSPNTKKTKSEMKFPSWKKSKWKTQISNEISNWREGGEWRGEEGRGGEEGRKGELGELEFNGTEVLDGP